MNPLSLVRTGSLVRGAGVAVACVVPGVARRAEVVATTYAAAWPIDRPGLQFLTVVPDEDEQAWRRAVVPIVTSAGSWTVAMSLAILGARRLRLPTPVSAVLLGAGVAVADTAMVGWTDRLKAKAAAAREQARSAPDAADSTTRGSATS
jgi:hypothetical protein